MHVPASPTRLFNSKVKFPTAIRKVYKQTSDAMSSAKPHKAPQAESGSSSQDEAEVNNTASLDGHESNSHTPRPSTAEELDSHQGGFLKGGDEHREWLKKRRNTSGTTNSSPTDPAYVPQKLGKTVRDTPTGQDAHPSTIVTGREKSFFDFDSESDESFGGDSQPIFGRASSVKIAKPIIIQHRPGGRDSRSQASSQSLEVPKKGNSNSHAANQPDSTSNQSLLPNDDSQGALERAKAYRMLTGEDSTDIAAVSTIALLPTSATGSTEENLKASDATYKTVEQLPTRSTLLSIHPRIGTVTEPTSAKTEPSTQSVLYNNLQTRSSSETAIPSRILSVPVPEKLEKRVTIKPPNLDTINSRDKTKFFRESIVSTPYPASAESHTDGFEFMEKGDAFMSVRVEDKPAPLQPKTFASRSEPLGEKDRFPSPERPEVLFLDFGLANQPGAKITLEIQVFDKSTFDDAILFRQIRAAYFKELLGYSRIVFSLVRSICYATAVTPKVSADFDCLDFTRHFQNPSLGYKRKVWTIWLRNQNPFSSDSQMYAPSTRPQSATLVPQLPNVDRLSLRTRLLSTQHSRVASNQKSLHMDQNVNDKSEDKGLSALSTANNVNFIYAPLSTGRLPFLSKSIEQSPSSPATCHSFFKAASSISSTSETIKNVTVTLHHRFSFFMVSFLLFCTVMSSVAATILWIIFGVPGANPGNTRAVGQRTRNDDNTAIAEDGFNGMKMSWMDAASMRVLTGLVLGLAILILGAIVDFGVIWGGWLLL